MSFGGGGGGSTTTVQKADPWSGLQGPLSQLYSGALAQYQTGGPQYYPGRTLASPNWQTNAALEGGEQRAAAGNPLMDASQQYLQQAMGGRSLADNPAYAGLAETASGKFLSPDSNPYLRSMVEAAGQPLTDQFQNAIAPALASQFSMAGRMGSGAHQGAFGQAADVLGRQLGNLSSTMYGNAYTTERGNQLGALGAISGQYGDERNRQQQAGLAAPGVASMAQSLDFDRISKLMGIGQYRQSQEQDLINSDRERFDFNQQRPLQNLQALNQLLQGGSAYAGSTSTGSQSLNRNPFASALGGAASAYGFGNVLGGQAGAALGGPWGLLGGALLGGLFG